MSLEGMSLEGRSVLVTGGTGFVGGRLVEKLAREQGARVRVLVRNFSRASRIARFDLEMIHGEITDPSVVEKAVEGCDVVFHCAYGNGGSAAQQRAVNVTGSEVVAEAVLGQETTRLVHVSTMAVYGRTPDGEVDEEQELDGSGDLYAQSKRQAEEILRDLQTRHGLQATILRPSCIYGPYGLAFTIYPLRELRAGRFVLVDGGEGLCNAVYIDDVVDALLLAATEPAALGQTFLISGDQAVPWKEFYGAYERMLGGPRAISRTADELRSTSLERAAAAERRRKLLRQLKDEGFTVTEEDTPLPFDTLSEHVISFYAAHTRLRCDKAKRLLGFRPRFNLDRGMKLTEAWARWAGLLPGERSS